MERLEVLEARIETAAAEVRVVLPASAISSLALFAQLLSSKGVQAGVIAAGDGPIVIERHIQDSLRAVSLVKGASHSYDLGSGGGLPGVVVAIAVPEHRVITVDRRRRKVGFVELATHTLGLSNVRPMLADISEIESKAPLCFARALASPEISWKLSAPILESGGRLIYFGGKGFRGVGEAADLVSCETVGPILLESGGPLAIMTRK